MKLIKSKLIQKAEGRKKAKYLATFEVTEYDMEMLEDLANTYAPFVSEDSADFNPKYQRWIKKMWHEFWQLWRRYDKY